MNIKIEKEILLEYLNYVVRGLSNKNLIPILNCIKIEVLEDGIYLTTTNNEIAIKTFIKKDKINEIINTGSIVIYGRFFYEIIKKLPNAIINIEEVIDNKINIYTENSSFYLNCNDINDFPNLNFLEKSNPITLNQKIFKNIINKTIYATSLNEERPFLTGINLKIKDNNLICSATDSYRISLKIIELKNKIKEEINIIIPNRSLNELIKILYEDDETIELHIFNNNILFKNKELIFSSQLINGSFPDTFNLIPKEFKIKINVDYNEIFNAIDRASLLSKEEDKQTITFEINKKEGIITSIIPEIGKVEEKIKILNNNEQKLTISFSSKYIIDALKTIEDNNIEICFNDNLSSILIKSLNDENFIQLFQPIRTY